MDFTTENESMLETLAVLLGFCILWILLMIPSHFYALRRIKYLEQHLTADSEAEIERIRSMLRHPWVCVSPTVIIFGVTELFKAIYERLNRVVGMAVIIVCSLTITFWAWVKGLWRRSEESGKTDVELGTHQAEEYQGGIPPNRRNHALEATNSPGEGF